MNRTRAIGPPDAAAGLGPFDAARSAFRIAAGVALHAAFLEHEGLAALRALGIQALPQQLRGVAGLLLHLDVCLDGGAELVADSDSARPTQTHTSQYACLFLNPKNHNTA